MAASKARQRLGRRRTTLGAFLQRHVEQALTPLGDLLAPEQLARVKVALEDWVHRDPVTRTYVAIMRGARRGPRRVRGCGRNG